MSIVEVARVAGVSHATVSNVINNRANVRANTAEMVRRAMAQIGYEPPPATRRPGRRGKLADGIRHGTIALVWPMSDLGQNAIACGLMEGVSRTLAQQNLKLLPLFAGPHTRVDEFADWIDAVDGCLVHGTLPDRFHPALRDKSVVWLGSVGPRGWGDRVSADNAQIARAAAEYLVDRGCQHLAFLNLDTAHTAYRDRGLWFEAHAQSLGLTGTKMIHAASAGETAVDNAPCARAFAEVMDWARTASILRDGAGSPPRARGPAGAGLFVACDRHLALLDRACRQAGDEPLAAVTLVGCDDDRAALLGSTHRPATFRIQSNLIGELAVTRLLDRLRQRTASPSAAEPGQIVVHVPALPVFPAFAD